MAIDFENGIIVPVTLHKKTKQYHEELNGKVRSGEMDIYIFSLRQSTKSDMFLSACLVDLDYCYTPEYKLKGTEFLAFVTFPIGKTVRVFFSEPSDHWPDYHFYIMTMDYNSALEVADGKNFDIEIIPREAEESYGHL